MKKFERFICPQCKHTQLESISNRNSLLIKIICRECGHQEILSNILGSK